MKLPLDVTRLLLEIVLAIALAEVVVTMVLPMLPIGGGRAGGAVASAAFLAMLAGPVIFWRVQSAARRARIAGSGIGRAATWRSVTVAAGVLVVGLVATATAASGAARASERVARAHFERLTERLTEETERRVDRARYGLAGARGLFVASTSVSREEFGAYVASRDLAEEFPGAIGFGFIERVEAADLGAFVARQRADGLPEFSVYGLADPGSPLAEASDRYVIAYCFPHTRNASAWGLDIGSEANRREAAERAVATGEPSISGRITLVQDGRRQTAFLYYLPVYRNGRAPVTPEERQDALVGLVYAPIILAESLAGATQAVEGGLDFEVFDGDGMSGDALLHDNDGHLADVEGLITPDHTSSRLFTAITPIRVGGRNWTVQTSTTPEFEAGVDGQTPALVAFGGGLLSLLAAGFAFSLLTGRTRAIDLAHAMTRDLAAAKAAAEEAKRETDAFRSTLDQHSIISVADRSGRIIDANPQFCRISGYELDELIGRDHRMLNSGTHPKRFWVEVWRSLAEGRAWRGEVCNRAKDGSLYWVDSVIAPFRGADGRIERYVSIRSDITQRKQGEEELLRIAERLELATRAGGVGIWDLDLATNDLVWDEQMFRLYGISGAMDAGSFDAYEAWLAGLHPEDRPRCEARMRSAIAGERPFDTEFRVVRPDGEVRSIRAIAVVQRDESGSPVRMVGTNWDVTAQRLAAAQLEAATASLEEAQAVAQIGNWMYDLESGAVSWSRQLFVLFGRDEADGPPDFEGVLGDYDAESAAALEAAVRRAVADGTPYSLVMRTNPAKGPVKYVRGEGRARRAPDGTVVALFGTAMDVTAEVRGAESLREAQQQAEAASLAKSAFLANMSHEIRTPLTAILGFAELLRDDEAAASTPEQRGQLVETIVAAGQHLLTVINDILDLSKIEADRMTVERIDTSLLRILGEVESLMRPRATGKGLVLRTELDTPLPEEIRSDPTRLRQILMNLVGNAIKFTEHGSVVVVAGARLEDRQWRLRIDITDTGPGMTGEQAGRLFQAFGQANETVSRSHGGTGLGLTICRRLAGLMGGTVTLERTVPGEGSTFRVDLPLELVPNTTMLTRLEAVRDPEESAEAERCAAPLVGRLLLAEDGVDNQRLIAFHLRKAGAKVDVADNGLIALRMIEAAAEAGEPYDLLLTDMQMPEMDGYTLARTLRDRGSVMPIVAITANAMAEDRERCEAAGCDDYATKPIDRAKLVETCRRWLGKAGAAHGRRAA